MGSSWGPPLRPEDEGKWKITPAHPAPSVAHDPKRPWVSRFVEPGEVCEIVRDIGERSVRVSLASDGYVAIVLRSELSRIRS